MLGTATKASYLNKVLASYTPVRNFASVAFNVKSKFETAYETKMKNVKAQPKKAYVLFPFGTSPKGISFMEKVGGPVSNNPVL